MENKQLAYSLKPIQFQDIEQAKKLSDAEMWNQTKEDWVFLINDPQSICIAAFDGETIVGTGTAIIYAKNIAWIGMILVEKQYRGKGISKKILASLFEQLELCRSIKLDATPAGQSVYQKFGFKDEYLVHRMTAASINEDILPIAEKLSVEPVNFREIEELIKYDQHVFGANRKQLLKYLIKNYPEKAFILRRGGSIAGFALGRKGARFNHIGPVMASSSEDAIGLIIMALRQLINQPVVIDILDDKKELIAGLTSIGFKKQRHFIRMYKNENPYPGNPQNQYLICGPEFG